MIDKLDAWLDDAWTERHQLGCAFLAMFLTIHLGQGVPVQVAVWLLAYIVVGMLADAISLIEALHDCVHDAADEAAVKMLAASDAARAEHREA